jgi:hypothetical protein
MAHEEHDVECADDAYVLPAMQSKHVVPPELYLPAAQLVHTVRPEALENSPAWHWMHVDCADKLLNDPMGH